MPKWEMSKENLRYELFGMDYVPPKENEWCDHVPERAGSFGSRLCRCGRCRIENTDMRGCSSANEFVEMVRRKMLEVGLQIDQEADVFGAAQVASHEMGKFRRQEFLATFFEVLKRANLDPRWNIGMSEGQLHNDTVIFRLTGPHIVVEKVVTRERFSYDSNRLLGELTAWVLDIVPHAKATDDVKPQVLEPLDPLPPGITRRIELE